MRRLAPALLAGVLALLGGACAEENASKFCVYNSDCGDAGTAFCVVGICRSEQCRAPIDCGPGEDCRDGRCVLPAGDTAGDAGGPEETR